MFCKPISVDSQQDVEIIITKPNKNCNFFTNIFDASSGTKMTDPILKCSQNLDLILFIVTSFAIKRELTDFSGLYYKILWQSQ